MTPQQQALIEHMLSELESPSKQLTDWEENFLESVAGQYAERRYLSDRQFEVLERIYTEKT